MGRSLLMIVVSIITILLVTPLIIIIIMSFTSDSFFAFPPRGFSINWYINFFENEIWLESLLRSLIVATLSAIVSVIIGTMAANGVIRLTFPGKSIFMGLLISPIVIPVIIIGIALYRFMAPFQLDGTLVGLVIAHSLMASPIAFITMLARLHGMDKNIELAAIALGSSPIGTFFRITLPFLRPALLSSLLLSFMVSFDEVVITIFLSGPNTKTLPVRMWENLHSNIDPTIAAISTILIISVVFIYVIQEIVKVKSDNSNV